MPCLMLYIYVKGLTYKNKDILTSMSQMCVAENHLHIMGEVGSAGWLEVRFLHLVDRDHKEINVLLL